jgi:hypothetical protein
MLQLVVSRSHALLQLAIVPNVQLLRDRGQRPELRTLLDKNFEGSKRDFYRSTGSSQMFLLSIVWIVSRTASLHGHGVDMISY